MNGPMLQAVLEDRFKVRIRRETRSVPVYALIADRRGVKVSPLEEGPCTVPPPLDFSKPPAQPEPGQKPFCRGMFGQKSPNLTWTVTLDEVANGLSSRLDRPVVNRTGLAGRFAFTLEFSPEGMSGPSRAGGVDPSAGASDPGIPPSIFTVLLEEVGLRLERSTGPGDVLVLDHVEQPSEN